LFPRKIIKGTCRFLNKHSFLADVVIKYLRPNQGWDQNAVSSSGGGAFFKVGGHTCTSKNFEKFLWFELATVTSETRKYDVVFVNVFKQFYAMFHKHSKTPFYTTVT